MRAKTELLLCQIHWVLSEIPVGFARPRYEVLFGSDYQADALQRQLQRLREKALIEEAEAAESRDRTYRLTELGRAALSGPEDPRARWGRAWDGVWRIVTFDIPERREAVRAAWRRELRRLKFGCLQGSVWVSPDPIDRIRELLAGGEVHAERLLFLEGRPAAGESDAEIVRCAWDLARLEQMYAQHRKVLNSLPGGDGETAALSRARLDAWWRRELAAWKDVVAVDPFLPQALCPAGYSGVAALEAREATLRRAGQLARRLWKH